LLVSSKDATIETLKQQIAFMDARARALAESAPDILLQRHEKRMALLEKELEAATNEKEPLLVEIEDLKQRLSASPSDVKRDALVSQLVAATQHIALLNAERQQVAQRIHEVEEPFVRFLHYANAEVSPGRRAIVGDIVNHIGLDRVISSKPDELVNAFSDVASKARTAGVHPKIPINGGALTGLRSIGLIDDRDELTLVGVSVLKTLAKELKSDPSIKTNHES
jgi:hypothetical protein